MKSLIFNKFNDRNNRNNDSFSRYAIIGIFIIIMLLIILVRTSILQLSSTQVNQIPETVGNRAQMTVQAPRGDIVDINGETLAYSITRPMLYLSNAGLSNRALNEMLLELSELMINNGVTLPDNLTQYFDLSLESKNNPSNNNMEFVFKKDISEIERWQQNNDLFGLKLEEDTNDPTQRVKTNPNDFYQYLLYDKFQIEDIKAAGDTIYTMEEAFKIMQLRYLILENNWQFLQGEAISIGGPVNQTIVNTINEQNQKYAGVLIADTSQRQYTEDSLLFSHVLGYIGNISEQEYQQLKNLSYNFNDVVGKSGVELYAERYLHGVPGSIPYGYWQRNTDNELEYVKGGGGISPQVGNKVRLTLNRSMQETTLQALSNNIERIKEKQDVKPNASSAVMMNVKTGAIISMASVPYYNPQDFSLAQYDDAAEERVREYFSDNEAKPMLNRAISEIYAPASTFKTISSIAAIENGVITPEDQVYLCNGTEEIGYRVWQCYSRPEDGHGALTLHDAMVTSCNLYFFKMGLDTGIEALSETYKKFGMGEYTNIDLPGEVKGIRPSPELKRQTQALPEDQIWFPADTAQSTIGQSFNAYTLVQLARGIGGVATGQLVQPHVIKEISNENGEIIKPEVIDVKDLNISETAISMVRDAMEGLARNPGSRTYEAFHDFPVSVAMKTGTAEVQNSSSENIQINAMFVCYAPADDPEVVFAGVVENADIESGLPDVARQMLDEYFGFN